MKKLRLIAPLLTMALLMGCTPDSRENEPDTVTVTGSAERQVMPDYYQVHLLLEERGADGTALAKPLEGKLETLLAIARDHGLSEDDIQAWEVQLQQERQWDREEQRHVLGDMRLSRKVRLNAGRETDMGALLGDILLSGTAQMQRIESRLHEPRAVQGELLAEATANARQRANSIAEGDERSLGRLIRAEEASGFERLMFAGARMEQADAAIRFEPEPIALSVSVQAVFALD